MGIRCGSPQWLLVAAVALLFTAAAFPGDVVTVTNSQEYSNAFRNSSVGTIILANDMKLDPVDWQEYNYNSPYHLKRNLTVQGDNSTDRWMVLDFNAGQVYKKVLIEPGVNISFIHMIGKQTRNGPGGDIDFFTASSNQGSIVYLHNFAKWQLACTPVNQAGVLAYKPSKWVYDIPVNHVEFPNVTTINNMTFYNNIWYRNFSTDLGITAAGEAVQEGGVVNHKVNSWKVCERFVTKECVNTRGADVCVKEQMRAMLAPDHPPASNLALRVGLGVGIPLLVLALAGAGWCCWRRRRLRDALLMPPDPPGAKDSSSLELKSIVVHGGDSSSLDYTPPGRFSSNMPDVLHGTCTKEEALNINLGLLLGSGSFGKVFRGRHRDQVVAVKVIQHDRTMADRVRNEVELMLSFSHPHVLRALDFVTWGRTGVSQMSVAEMRTMRGSAGPTSLNSGGPSAQTASRSQASSGRTSGSSGMSGAGRHGVETWVVLEYCNGGTLYDAAVRDDSALFVRDIMQVEAVLQLLLGVARGMAYLHNHNVCHGDLKAANVLLTSVAEGGAAPLAVSTSASNTATTSTNITGTTGSAINVSMACCYVTSSGPHALDRGTRFVPKVADFGLSRMLNEGQTHLSTHTMGTITHQPPELMKTGRLARPCDVFAFGVLMWEVAQRSSPWKGAMMGEVISNVLVDRLRPDFTVAPKAYVDLAKACWEEDPRARPTFPDIVQQLNDLLPQASEMQQELEGLWQELRGSW